MAVVDKYVDADVAAGDGKRHSAAKVSGAKVQSFVTTFEVAVADDDGSVYRIGKSLGGSLIPIDIKLASDDLTLGTDWDLGLYDVDSGAVIDKDVFADGLNFAGADRFLDGLVTVAIENLVKPIYEHAGDTVKTQRRGYDLALTANTVGTAAGTVTAIVTFIEG